MQAHLFGSIRVDLDGRRLDARSFGGRKPKQLLEILLVGRGRSVTAQQLAALLWDGDAPRDHPATVQHYVSVLRRRLPRCPVRGSLLITTRGGYALDASRLTLDLDRFDAAVEAADAAPAALRRPLLGRALELVRGDVLSDEPAAPWASEVRSRYRRSHVGVLLQAAAAALASAEPRPALELAARAGALEPDAESVACLLMAAHYATGDVEGALRAFERCRDGLADSLGVDPMPKTVAMQQAVLRGAPAGKLVTHALLVAQAQSPRATALPAPVPVP